MIGNRISGFILIILVVLLAGCVSQEAPATPPPQEHVPPVTVAPTPTGVPYSPELESENLNYQGYLAMVTGSYDEAISFFDQALAINPDFAPALNNKGYAYYKKGDLENALVYFERAYEQDPDNHIVCANKVQAAYDLGKMVDLNQCRLINTQWGFCFINIGDISGSMRTPVNPLDPGMWKEKATGDYMAKCKVYFYRNYLELEPVDAISWNNYAVVLAQSGHTEEANEAIDKALSLNPGNQTFMKNKDGIRQYGNQMSYKQGEILEVSPPIRFSKGRPYFDVSFNISETSTT